MILRFRMRVRPLASALLALVLLLATALGCGATHICTLVGCIGGATVTYSQPVQGAYTLDVKGGSVIPVSATGVACPSAQAVALANDVTLTCTSTSFILSGFVTDGPDGGPVLPTLSVTITAANVALATDAAVPTAPGATDFPNGPDCGGACYDIKGEVALAP
jgi:hypothetical protein